MFWLLQTVPCNPRPYFRERWKQRRAGFSRLLRLGHCLHCVKWLQLVPTGSRQREDLLDTPLLLKGAQVLQGLLIGSKFNSSLITPVLLNCGLKHYINLESVCMCHSIWAEVSWPRAEIGSFLPMWAMEIELGCQSLEPYQLSHLTGP